MTKCDACEAPATHGTTDSIQTAEGWIETPNSRNGCAVHPVEALVHMLDGRTLTMREYERDYVAA